MNLIILAAGSGKRLYPLTKNTPKSLLDLGDGTTLLDRQLTNAIESHTINKVYIITGYLSHQIEEAIVKYNSQIDIQTIHNPYFAVSNNLMSLWCAHYILEENDFLVSNGDNIYKSHVYDSVLSGAGDCIQLTIDYKEKYDDDDMKVLLDSSGGIVKVSKQIDTNKAQAESVGLVLVKGEENRKLFRNKLIELSKNEDYMNAFWLELFNRLVDDGIEVKSKEIALSDWREVDFHPDISSLRQAIFKEIF